MSAGLDRRHALTGAALTAVALPVLAGCGDDSARPGTTGDPEPADSSSTGAPSGSTSAGGLTTTAEVPVGGCAVFPDERVVVTQPSDGEFRAFSAVCTHQGCIVSSSSDGVIPCGCHGSQFSLEDGSVLEGPATGPLSEVEITVKGDTITLA